VTVGTTTMLGHLAILTLQVAIMRGLRWHFTIEKNGDGKLHVKYGIYIEKRQ